MPCVNRRGCQERFEKCLDDRQMLIILSHHGSCSACGKDATDYPRFKDDKPFCPACFEERWPTGAPGPFERGADQVYPDETVG